MIGARDHADPAVLPFLALSKYTAEALTVLFVTLGCAAIGFADDYLKLRRRHSLGLPGRFPRVARNLADPRISKCLLATCTSRF